LTKHSHDNNVEHGDGDHSRAHDRHAIVSSDEDLLILVNDNDEQIGEADKLVCHDGDGLLHRAFSVLIFNSQGEVLLQKRADQKRLWGGYWSNSCCSHPRIGETMDEASQRRLWQELGLRAELVFLYKFQYHADFGEAGAEHELCWVYIGKSDTPPSTNANEVSECRYVAPSDLEQEFIDHPEQFTPWFKLEWERIKSAHAQALAAL